MPRQSVLGGVIGFLDQIGIFEVVLPFILTFTIVFAILEKTKILGTEKIEGEMYPRKNLNAMTAFVIGFFVIASSQLVAVLTQVSSQVVILLMMIIFFLMLVGTFYKEDEEVSLEKRWRALFMVIAFVGIALIFLQAIKLRSGESWLEYGLRFLSQYWSAPAVASIILIAGIIFFMVWVTKEGKPKEDK